MIKGYNLKVSKNFWMVELFPKAAFEKQGIPPQWYLTNFLTVIPQAIRDYFGKPVMINNWYNGGDLHNRGFRMPINPVNPPESRSLHKYGMAIDINVEGMDDEEVLIAIIKNYDKFPMIKAYEDPAFTKGWIHLDGRTTSSSSLLKVKPS